MKAVPATSEQLAKIRPQDFVRCVYCNARLVLGATTIMTHEQFCPDRQVVVRQQTRARERFLKKQAGFA